ncbi:MAG: nitroreductase family protein [Dehalococcoidales bacterium]
MFKDLVLKCRSYRRFYEDVAVDNKTLREFVDLARLSASAVNRQPLKYILSSSREKNALIFSTLHWAGTLKTWPGPAEGERPAGYIIILGDKEIGAGFGLDPGIAAQTILLGAVEKGLGGCMLGAVDKEDLRRLLNIPARYETSLVIALGKPKEKIILEIMNPTDSFDYWRDKDEGHHVPKRKLNDIIVAEY